MDWSAMALVGQWRELGRRGQVIVNVESDFPEAVPARRDALHQRGGK